MTDANLKIVTTKMTKTATAMQEADRAARERIAPPRRHASTDLRAPFRRDDFDCDARFGIDQQDGCVRR
jgi:hypothetical protein